jgi:hypothetical protein
MGIKDFADKAKDALGDVVDKVDDATGGKVPDAVKNAVDKVDGEVDEEE